MRQPDDDPILHIDLGDDRELDLGPDNTSLFTHVGEAAMYDHIFVQTGEQETGLSGMYIFRHNEAFKAIKKHMIRNRFPLHLNQQEAAECDVSAFDRALERAMDDTDYLPDDWIE
jgi:hypothetical protein